MKMVEDAIEKVIGRFGRYQTWILILVSVGRLPAEFALSNVVFILPKTDYKCADEGTQNLTNHCPCQNPEFDTSPIVTSITSDFKLICNRETLSSLAQSMLQVGIAVGSLFYGYISDKFGRRIAVVLALFCNSVFGTLSTFSSQLWMVIVCRFLSGTALGGTMLCCYVLIIELSGKSFRVQSMGLVELSYISANFLLPIIAYYVREWRHLQMITSTPWLLVIVFYWLIPESPRWLITIGKKKDAIAVLTHIATRKNEPTENIEAIVDQMEAELVLSKSPHQRSGSYADLFRTPRIRVYSIITPYVWSVCAVTFFGINQYIGRLGGNLYLNVFLSAACLLPAVALVVIASLYLRRKTTMITCFSVTSIALLTFLIVPKNRETVILALAIIGQTGAYSAFVLIYLFTTEIFPTVIRNSAMGLCSVCGRIGGIAAPFVVNIGIEWVSILIFSVFALSAAVSCYLLPDTNHIMLLNSIEQAEFTHNTIIGESKKNIRCTVIGRTAYYSKREEPE